MSTTPDPSTPDPAAPTRPPEAPKIDAAPILELEDNTCLRCGAPMGPDDVVCLKCGYDMRANVARSTKQAEEYQPDEPQPFVVPTWGSPKALLILGSVFFLAAMITAGVNVPAGKSFWLIVGSVLLVIYEVLVHTGTGVVAVAVSARICEQKFGNFELAVSRVFAAFSAFELAFQLSLRIPAVGVWAAFVIGPAAYWVLIWALFRKSRTITTLIVLCHVVLWLIIQLGMQLSAMVQSARGVAAVVGMIAP
ncbi:MAG: hypothetical protein KF745_03065 [Phycisphaeraceae bacterium]|nr:hypothetical protein [Phycisphaeraceae bacterium]